MIADVQLIDFQPQRVGIEADDADIHWACEALHNLHFQDVPEDRRDDEKTEDREQD